MNTIKPRVTVIELPSTESAGNECSLLFLVPSGMNHNTLVTRIKAAINGANDENGERSDEVIAGLREHGFTFLGNPDCVEEWPFGMNEYFVSNPWDKHVVGSMTEAEFTAKTKQLEAEIQREDAGKKNPSLALQEKVLHNRERNRLAEELHQFRLNYFEIVSPPVHLHRLELEREGGFWCAKMVALIQSDAADVDEASSPITKTLQAMFKDEADQTALNLFCAPLVDTKHGLLLYDLPMADEDPCVLAKSITETKAIIEGKFAHPGEQAGDKIHCAYVGHEAGMAHLMTESHLFASPLAQAKKPSMGM